MTSEARLRPVSHWLRRVKDPQVRENHPLKTYQAAFNGFERLGYQILSSGVNTVNVELEDGNVLKIGTRELRSDAGKREFDMPILEQGTRTTLDGLVVRFYIQPKARPLPPQLYKTFLNKIYQLGYNFIGPGEQQVGLYNGEPRLLDPWSVAKKTSFVCPESGAQVRLRLRLSTAVSPLADKLKALWAWTGAEVNEISRKSGRKRA